LWWRGAPFIITDRGHGGSSRIAAGLINPVTGKNFQPSWRIDEFLPEAITFYQSAAVTLGKSFWHPLPILRLAASAAEWKKISAKFQSPEVAPWVIAETTPPPGWHAALRLQGGGWLDTRGFLDASRDFFKSHGLYQETETDASNPSPHLIRCEGAAGLLKNQLGPHRCAKGEILTVRAAGFDPTQIRVGGGGWLIPLGGDRFKAGATYEWNQLDETPTPHAAARILEILKSHGISSPTIIHHNAGIRPILRRSQPLIGHHPTGGWAFNGLGSKGSLYAPGIARHLANSLLDSGPAPGGGGGRGARAA
jgi:glycine/D-amino acid oxidase-like deaminating enzyme